MFFLVIESDPIVLLDVMSSLKQRFPQAVVEYSKTLNEARDKLAEVRELTAAFVGASQSDFAMTDLPDIVEERNGKIIVAHYGSHDLLEDAISRGWVPMAVPFTNETLDLTLSRFGPLCPLK